LRTLVSAERNPVRWLPPSTVPTAVRTAMRQHDLYRHYVIQYEISSTPGKPFPSVSDKVVASINTHDMPTFAAFWQGDDIQQRYELGLLDKNGAKQEHVKRLHLRKIIAQFLKRGRFITESKPGIREILKGVLTFLSSSPAQIVLINLEDLWLETKPQNTPGTLEENRNYCRKLSYPFEELSQSHEVLEILSEVNQGRKGER
jgi:4-alpha-glucanotransferase